MDEQNIRPTSYTSSLLSGLGSSSAGFIGRSAKNTSTPFLMPDDNSSGSSGGGSYSFGGQSLSEKYDLGRHMMTDRRTAQASGKAQGGTKASQAAADTSTTPQEPTSPTLSNSRALISNQASGGGGEKAAGNIASTTRTPKATGATKSVITLHSIEGKALDKQSNTNGTANASRETEMIYLADNARQADCAQARSDKQSEPVVLREDIHLVDADGGKEREKRQDQRGDSNKEYADASLSLSASSNSVSEITPGSDRLQTPRMEQVSREIMDQIERIRANRQSTSADLSIEMPDGTTLDMQLRWRGNHVTARFSAQASRMQAEIENGWASLTHRAGNAGMKLEAPVFDDEPAFDTTRQYA